jgi:hypothetical protein
VCELISVFPAPIPLFCTMFRNSRHFKGAMQSLRNIHPHISYVYISLPAKSLSANDVVCTAFKFPLIFDTLYKSIWLQAARKACLEPDMLFLFQRIVNDSVDTTVAVDTDVPKTRRQNVNYMIRSNAAIPLNTVKVPWPNSTHNRKQTKPASTTSSRHHQGDDYVEADMPMSSEERRHFSLLAHYRDRWRPHKVQDYCPACILRRPEYGLPCGHMYCEQDIRRLGRKVWSDTYAVDKCICCLVHFVGVVFKFRPKTRGIRVLALDGGGVRGIMILICLKRLQERLWQFLPGMPIMEFFDVCTGTSSGKS